MKHDSRVVGAVGLVLVAVAAATAPPARAQLPASRASGDSLSPFQPLRLYDGTWSAESHVGGTTTHSTFTDVCRRPGRFFVCEQVVGGKTQALIVFLPTGDSSGVLAYRTQALPVGGEPSGKWGQLRITGSRWVYTSGGLENGAPVYWRTINVFSGKDTIHFEIQRSDDGINWVTQRNGDEHRAKS